MTFKEIAVLVVNSLPALLIALGTIVGVGFLRYLFCRRPVFSNQHTFLRNAVVVMILGSGLVGVIVSLPIEEGLRNSLMQLLGILVGLAVALSSTTFVGNAMAGCMLRIIRNFRFGDYIEVGEMAGRVCEQGIFHTELQTEESNLVTLPNLYLVTNPVTVLRKSGTILSASVSLGYDIDHTKVEQALRKAAEKSKLQDPFVQVTALGDYSIVYRCAGVLEEFKGLNAARSRLMKEMIDALHEDGIEIVSPAFLNRREIGPTQLFVPAASPRFSGRYQVADAPPEEKVFDKATLAAAADELETQIGDLVAETEKLRAQMKSAADESALKHLEGKIARNEVYQSFLERQLHQAQSTLMDQDDTLM